MVLIIAGYNEEDSKALAAKVMGDWEAAKNEGVPYVMFLPQGIDLSKNEGAYLKGSWVVKDTAVTKIFEPEVLQSPRLLIVHGHKVDIQEKLANALLKQWEVCIQRAEPFELEIPQGILVGSFPGNIQSAMCFVPKDGPPEIHIEMSEQLQRSGRCEL